MCVAVGVRERLLRGKGSPSPLRPTDSVLQLTTALEYSARLPFGRAIDGVRSLANIRKAGLTQHPSDQPEAITPKTLTGTDALHHPKRLRVGLCTDTHYWPGAEDQVGAAGNLMFQSHFEQIQDALIADLAAADLDQVIHLGDVTCGGGTFLMSESAFEATVVQSRKKLQTLPAAVHALPGNHDCPPGGGDWSFFEEQWGLKSGQGKTIDFPNVRLILVNAQGHSTMQIEEAKPSDPIYGWLNDAELARIEEALSTAGTRPVVLFMHQCLYQPTANLDYWADYFLIKNRKALLALMERFGNVRAVFQGHAHRFDVQTSTIAAKPCTFVISPPLAEYPLAWLLLTIDSTQLHVSVRPLPLPALSEEGRQSGAGQSWREGLPERQEFTIEL